MKYVDGAFDRARTLLGERVVVSLDDQAVVTGMLLTVSDGGEVVLVDDMGFHHYCWPLLDIRPSTPENVEER